MNIKALIFCSIINLLGFHANAAEKTDSQSQIDKSLKKADDEYRAYQKSKREVWAYEQLKNCHNIQDSEYEQMFIRYMRKKHPVEAREVIFDTSPTSMRMTRIFADTFISQEVTPREKDFYLAYGRCPNLNELPFPY